MHTPIRLLLTIAALTTPAALRADSNADRDKIRVDVVVDVTEAGKKIAPPNPDKPAYYLPVPIGYKEFGYVPQLNRPPPPPEAVEHMLGVALAQRGYHLMSKQNRPSLVLNFWWGYMAPMEDGTQMRQLVGGDSIGDESNILDPRRQEALQMLFYPRYYIFIAAYDFDSWLKNLKETRQGGPVADKPIRLWRAHLSTELEGHDFDQVAQALVNAGAPWLGRETSGPRFATAPLVPTGRVILGTPVVEAGGPAFPP